MMKQYRGSIATLMSHDLVEKLTNGSTVWVAVDGDVHNMVLQDEKNTYYVELTVRQKTRPDATSPDELS